MDPDAPLILRIGEGDQEAIRILVDRHLDRLVAVCFRVLGSYQEAEDVTQEVFLKVWQQAKKWEFGNAKFSTWLHRVALNLCYDRMRKKREVLVDTLPERSDPAPGALEQVTQSETAHEVQAAVQQLSERQRTAIFLCHFEGCNNIEAAEIMEVSVEAIESLLSRGRRKLREILEVKHPELMGR